MVDKSSIEFCKHYDREEIDQFVYIKRIRCKDCDLYKCLECDNFFIDKPIRFSKLRLNFCSSKCMFENMRKEEEQQKKEKEDNS